MEKKSRKQEVYEQLKISLQKEIHIMRELLANMHLEELSLQFQDKKEWEQVMIERSHMVSRLKFVREARLLAMQDFEIHSSFEDSDALEILSLRDQLLALAERMNLIRNRNEHLATVFPLREGGMPRPSSSAPQIQRPKRKTSIATYPPKQ